MADWMFGLLSPEIGVAAVTQAAVEQIVERVGISPETPTFPCHVTRRSAEIISARELCAQPKSPKNKIPRTIILNFTLSFCILRIPLYIVLSFARANQFTRRPVGAAGGVVSGSITLYPLVPATLESQEPFRPVSGCGQV